jgi:hypothetical protein
MSVLRLIAITVIFFGCTFAWMILGGTVVSRTGESDYALRQEVEALWGTPHLQSAPRVFHVVEREVERDSEEYLANGSRVTRRVKTLEAQENDLSLTSSTVSAKLELEHRKKGLMWFPTYAVDYKGRYTVENPLAEPKRFTVEFQFPSTSAIYDGFTFSIDGKRATDVTNLSRGAQGTIDLLPGQRATIEVAYRSRGLETWTYRFGDGISSVQSFALALETDFDNVNFPAGSISPTTNARAGVGRSLTWAFDHLVTGQTIGLEMPTRLNPGPVVSRVSFFAPVSLLFFFTVLVILGVVKNRSMHPMHYFFLGASFFAFHLLLAYLVDHMEVEGAFAIAAVVSTGLVVSYLRVVQGMRRAVLEAGLAQLVFLVLFSVAFFFEGQTGLAVAVGAIVTLFVLMQTTARVDWNHVFGSKAHASGAPLGVFSGFTPGSAPSAENGAVPSDDALA